MFTSFQTEKNCQKNEKSLVVFFLSNLQIQNLTNQNKTT